MTVQVPDSEVIRNAVTLACHAPLLHNSQPWRWLAEGANLHLWADPVEPITVADDERMHTAALAATFDGQVERLAVGTLV
jgi:hypothetical protein